MENSLRVVLVQVSSKIPMQEERVLQTTPIDLRGRNY